VLLVNLEAVAHVAGITFARVDFDLAKCPFVTRKTLAIIRRITSTRIRSALSVPRTTLMLGTTPVRIYVTGPIYIFLKSTDAFALVIRSLFRTIWGIVELHGKRITRQVFTKAASSIARTLTALVNIIPRNSMTRTSMVSCVFIYGSVIWDSIAVVFTRNATGVGVGRAADPIIHRVRKCTIGSTIGLAYIRARLAVVTSP
jgi:hypothetical protein